MSTAEKVGHQCRSEGVKALHRMPHWSQLTDSMGSYGPDSNRTEDCGEECCSMLVYSVRGIEVPAGYIRWLLGVADGRGTSGQDLVRYLHREGFGEAQVRYPNLPGAWEAVRREAAEGRPCIVLGFWLDASIGHWAIPLATGDDNWLRADPWAGEHVRMPKTHFGDYFGGQLVVIGSRSHYPVPGQPWYPR